jgi:5-(carboxyamino)imidazole ribonucleotide mutase
MSSANQPARIAIVMGSKSDWATMQFATEILDILNVPHHVEVVSAHRTPDKLFSFAESAEENGFQVIIAGAGGAAHLPGMIAAKTLVPVLGVPVQSAALSGVDSLYSIVQMPRGIPVGTLAIGKAGPRMPPCWPRKSWHSTTPNCISAWPSSVALRPTKCWKTRIHGVRHETGLHFR